MIKVYMTATRQFILSHGVTTQMRVQVLMLSMTTKPDSPCEKASDTEENRVLA